MLCGGRVDAVHGARKKVRTLLRAGDSAAIISEGPVRVELQLRSHAAWRRLDLGRTSASFFASHRRHGIVSASSLRG